MGRISGTLPAGNLCDAFVLKKESGAYVVPAALFRQLLDATLKAAKDSEKVKPNAMRALGGLGRCLDSSFSRDEEVGFRIRIRGLGFSDFFTVRPTHAKPTFSYWGGFGLCNLSLSLSLHPGEADDHGYFRGALQEPQLRAGQSAMERSVRVREPVQERGPRLRSDRLGGECAHVHASAPGQ